jgi:hypothetical protein
MAFLQGTSPTFNTFEDGHRRLFRIMRRFIVGAPEINTVSYTGTGNGVIGKIDTYPSSPVENWTITFTSATAFTVTGSVSGAQAGGTTGTDYNNGKIAFRINVGGTAFVATDQFVITLVATTNAGTDIWIEDRYNPHSSDLEWIAHGTGLGGSDAIYAGTRMSETPVSNLWHLEMRGFTGFDPGQGFTTQPGISPANYVALWNQTHPFWLAVNGRRWAFVARVSTTYHAGYLGFILPYTLPSEYPYPFLVGGETLNPVTWSSTSSLSHHVMFSNAAAQFRRVDGTWRDLNTSTAAVTVWPTMSSAGSSGAGNATMSVLETPSVGEYVLYPLVLIDLANLNAPLSSTVLGEMDGVFAIPGFNNSSENVVTVSSVDYVVVQNIFRTSRDQFWALRKD